MSSKRRQTSLMIQTEQYALFEIMVYLLHWFDIRGIICLKVALALSAKKAKYITQIGVNL